MIKELNLPNKFKKFASHHDSSWIRLISHRLLGHIFTIQQKQKSNLIDALSLDIPEQLSKFTLELL